MNDEMKTAEQLQEELRAAKGTIKFLIKALTEFVDGAEIMQPDTLRQIIYAARQPVIERFEELYYGREGEPMLPQWAHDSVTFSLGMAVNDVI